MIISLGVCCLLCTLHFSLTYILLLKALKLLLIQRQLTNIQGEKMKLMDEMAEHKSKVSLLRLRLEQKQVTARNCTLQQFCIIIRTCNIFTSAERIFSSDREERFSGRTVCARK